MNGDDNIINIQAILQVFITLKNIKTEKTTYTNNTVTFKKIIMIDNLDVQELIETIRDYGSYINNPSKEPFDFLEAYEDLLNTLDIMNTNMIITTTDDPLYLKYDKMDNITKYSINLVETLEDKEYKFVKTITQTI